MSLSAKYSDVAHDLFKWALRAFTAASIVFLTTAHAEADPARIIHTYSSAIISPAGDKVASLEADEADFAPSEPHHILVIRNSSTGAVIQKADPCPGCAYADPTFSPDGKTIAIFGSDQVSGDSSLYLIRGGDISVRLRIHGAAAHPAFSPDGKTLAYLTVIAPQKSVGPSQASAPMVGEIRDAFDEQRIAVISLAGRDQPRLVTPADTFVFEFDWRPDGKGFVATAVKGDGDNNWYVAELQGFDLVSGEARRLAKPVDQMADPHASPSGRQIAFISGLMSDSGWVGGDIFVVPAQGGDPKNLTPGFGGSFNSLTWRGDKIIATALVGDKSTLMSINPETGKLEVLSAAAVTLDAGPGRIALDAAGRRAVAEIQDFEHPPELTSGPLSSLGLGGRITDANAGLSSPGLGRSIEWTNNERTVQGWVLKPKNSSSDKKHPMVVLVHGGPGNAETPIFPRGTFSNGPVLKLLNAGYYVFLPNPRGSFGQGEAFTKANVRDFGGGDFRDIMTGVDAVLKAEAVDPARLGVAGHSYGAFMTMWIVTHTDRFKAAVADAGISNWNSYYGQTGIERWMIPFFKASAYDDPALYQKLSPMSAIKNAKTPTLIYVGDRDLECPPPQSMEFWRGLKAMGVPTKLFLLADEGHELRDPKHISLMNEEQLQWLSKYVKGD